VIAPFSPPALARAFREVGPTAMPGTDGVSGFAFARRLDHECAALAGEVASGRYRPRALLRRERRKESGGVRVLGIPSVRDRVLQRAALDALTPQIELRLSPRVHGYRPRHSPSTALAMLCDQAGQAQGTVLVKADVAGLFDVVPHSVVRLAAATLLGPPWPGLLEAWLLAWPTSPDRGVPQGAPLSPALANLVLDRVLDRPLEQALPPLPRLRTWIRYGDDVAIVGLQADGVRIVQHLGGLLAGGGMSLAPGKVLSAEARRGPVPFALLGARLRWAAQDGGLRLERGL